MITGAQMRAARKLLGWKQPQLAKASKLLLTTIKRAEATDSEPNVRDANLAAIQAALESAGVEFTNGGQPGVRMRGALESIPVENLNSSNDE